MPISYVTIGTNDYDRALDFFDALTAELGGGRAFEAPGGQFYQLGEPVGQGTLLGIFKPADGQPATHGNGTMIAIKVEGEPRVRAVHAKALALGAADEGAPGPRGDKGFYAGYFRDPDGNKFCVYRM
jgi:catechol 2,3-dioxygenase-like lactoylglutathione lyase family enzyme